MNGVPRVTSAPLRWCAPESRPGMVPELRRRRPAAGRRAADDATASRSPGSACSSGPRWLASWSAPRRGAAAAAHRRGGRLGRPGARADRCSTRRCVAPPGLGPPCRCGGGCTAPRCWARDGCPPA